MSTNEERDAEEESAVQDDNQLQQTHATEIMLLVRTLPDAAKDTHEYERVLERYQCLLDQYQEQPHLLDSIFRPMIDQLLCHVQLADLRAHLCTPTSKLAFAYLQHASKVRGEKSLLRVLPHEVNLVPVVLGALELCADNWRQKDRSVPWETEFVLLLWMCILTKLPFDLCRFDSGTDNTSMIERIRCVASLYVLRPDKTQSMGSWLLAELLARPDVSSKFLANAVQSIFDEINALDDIQQIHNARAACGQLRLLARILKLARRDELQSVAAQLVHKVCALKVDNSDATLRKLVVKIIQRCGLLLLPPKLAVWRYDRGTRSLEHNLNPKLQDENDQKGANTEEDSDVELCAELEIVFDRLLTALSEKDTIVRWSGAKGVGRVCMRLPVHTANDVLQSVFSALHTAPDEPSTLHGCCLALAELARRGLLLPHWLPQTVTVLCKALLFDRRSGRHSVGSQVRDAACYVCWSLARAFSSTQLQPHVPALAAAMLTVAVTDREINVRRAAAAAFQENVGRQRTFAHGIELVTAIDYLAVGQRTRCYKQLCVLVASFDEYYQPLLKNLLEDKLQHWDENIRRLCADALGTITQHRPEYCTQHVLPSVTLRALSKGDMFERQGALIALGRVLKALAPITPHIIDMHKYTGLVATIMSNSAVYLRGVSADPTKIGLNEFVCDLCEAVQMTDTPIQPAQLQTLNQAVLNNITHKRPDIRHKAALALYALHVLYERLPPEQALDTTVYSRMLQSASNEQDRQGAALALGALSEHMLCTAPAQCTQLMDILIQAANSYTQLDTCWADARVDCLNAVNKLCARTQYLQHLPAADRPQQLVSVYSCYMRALDDYTIDKRGDIGRYVRDAAMTHLCDWLTHQGVLDTLPIAQLNQLLHTATLKLITQAAEKIDASRVLAARVLRTLIEQPVLREQLQDRAVLGQVFLTVPVADMASAGVAYPQLAPLLSSRVYCKSALVSFVVSAGGLSETTQRAANEALLASCERESAFVCALLLQLLQEHTHTDRVFTPLLNTLDALLAQEALHDSDPQCLHDIFTLVTQESLCKRSIRRVSLGVSVCCAFIQFDHLRVEALTKVCTCLLHVYPVVRRNSADKLYEALLLFAQLDNHNEHVMGLLAGTQWDADVQLLQPIVHDIQTRLCQD